MRRLVAALTLSTAGALGANLVLAQESPRPPATQRNFVSCPVVQDTKTLPCWLAEYEGELYFLGLQGSTASDFYPPQLRHDVLVEGTVTDGPRVCGGIPLKPIRISALPELNDACNTIRPVDDRFDSPSAPARRFTPDMRNAGTDTSQRAFSVPFDFDNDYLTFHTTRMVGEAARIAKAISASRVDVVGYRATSWLSNGRRYVEREPVASTRARKVGAMLVGLGLPADRVKVTWKSEPEAANGVTDADNRRVTIAIVP